MCNLEKWPLLNATLNGQYYGIREGHTNLILISTPANLAIAVLLTLIQPLER